MSTDLYYMSQALQLAERGIYTTSPNPAVGCVIVNQDRIVGEGYHQFAGGKHAEILALTTAGALTRGATAYVTLEPCCHFGKTPPCTSALIEAGVKKIIVACEDPNPLVCGKGIASLRDAGIEVIVGVKATEAAQLNQAFFYAMRTGLPFVIAKWAMSLDGKTIAHPDDERHISTAASQLSAHEIRRRVDAIIIGARTAVRDNPQLSVRHLPAHKIERQPLRIVVTARGGLPLDLYLFNCDPQKTMVATTAGADANWVRALETRGVRILTLPQSKEGQVCLRSLLVALGKMQILQVLVEGGMTLHESFFNENLVNKIHVYLAPVIIGSMPKKQFILNMQSVQHHHDFQFIADYQENTNV